MTLATFLQWQFASNSCTVNASLPQAESSNCPFGRAAGAAKSPGSSPPSSQPNIIHRGKFVFL